MVVTDLPVWIHLLKKINNPEANSGVVDCVKNVYCTRKYSPTYFIGGTILARIQPSSKLEGISALQ